MVPTPRQGDLIAQTSWSSSSDAPGLSLSAPQLRQWQRRIQRHQAPLFAGHGQPMALQQTQLFEAPADPLAALAPLSLRPLPLTFWRWPESPHQGAAIYLVMDRPHDLSTPILLYVGETKAADRRWKGEHDCKAYLAAYGDALCSAGLPQQTSIRFWTDVPADTRQRRRLEQALIQAWLPPFNKETRDRWATPFSTD